MNVKRHNITGVIDDSSLRALESFMSWAEATSTDEVIIQIHSDGGDFDAAVAMYERLRSSSLRVRTCCTRALSSATIIAQGASKGCRSVVQDSFYLIHECYTTCSGDYRLRKVERIVSELKRCNAMLVGIYVESGCSREKIEALLSLCEGEGELLIPQEVLSYGLADVIEPCAPLLDASHSSRSLRDVFRLLYRILCRYIFR